MRRVLLIGGAGYIGTVLTDKLLREGCEVVCFDSLVYRHSRVVSGYLGRQGYSFVLGIFAVQLISIRCWMAFPTS